MTTASHSVDQFIGVLICASEDSIEGIDAGGYSKFWYKDEDGEEYEKALNYINEHATVGCC